MSTRQPFHCLPPVEAGARMPSHVSIIAQDHERRRDAKIGSERLRNAILDYFERGGRG